MIVWTRMGFLVAVYAFGSSLVAQLLTNHFTGTETYWDAHRWPVGVALIGAGLLSFVTSSLLGRRNQSAHTLFFVPVFWWGPLLWLGGLGVLAWDLWLRQR